jgi:hypothetical protein
MYASTWSIPVQSQSNPQHLHKSMKGLRRSRTTRKSVSRLVLLVFLLISVSLSFGLMFKANADGREDPAARTAGHKTVDVGPGESLWSIARDNAGGKNIRAYIAELKDLNGLHSSNLEVGQILYLP